jgi:hypothetical protein
LAVGGRGRERSGTFARGELVANGGAREKKRRRDARRRRRRAKYLDFVNFSAEGVALTTRARAASGLRVSRDGA